MEQVKVRDAISQRKRAKTWEISDSEDEESDCIVKADIKGSKAEIKCVKVLCDLGDGSNVKKEPNESGDQGGPDGQHGWAGPGLKSGIAELCETQAGDGHPSAPITSTLSLPSPKSATPSPVRRTRKKKSSEEVEAYRAEPKERKRAELCEAQEGDGHLSAPTSSTLSLPSPKSATPSPVRRTRRKKSPEEVEAYRAELCEAQEGDGHPSALITSTLSLPPPKSTTPSPVRRTRKKKSPEEVEADRAQAEERKREKEVKRQEKERFKILEKEEREKRKESAQALKLLRPDQCGKYMLVQVDAGLLQDAASEDLLETLTTAGYKYSIEPHAVPFSITWRRELPIDWTCVDGLELCKGEEDQMLILVEPRDFLKRVSCYSEALENSKTWETLSSAFAMDRKYPGKKMTLAVLGLHDYRRYQRLSQKMERHSLEPRHFYDEQQESHLTRQQIDEALVYLQLYHETEVLFLDTWRELGQHICFMTKSIAQRPFRLNWEPQSYSFCTSASTWRGWGPKGSLTGLPLAWRRQIQQFNRVSPAMAAAITEVYPSPQLLMQAYVACNSDKERLSLLSNLRIPRAAGTAEDMGDPDDEVTQANNQDQARERRIGPDLSRRIWLFMTSTNPELVLDLN
ncbi:probable crossover junction endonuclease EME2 [Pyxicephalus adspersus]|uniref:ERCC4 domain-containing protein n=1 Tax=Pyxicephalus adspersus TaxID=30357 RepID=A0AAV3B1W0_PYXAD|nr:TPA: hypothetical protein GDO54_001585 [Pyxicephalus adspersus]